MQELNIKEMEQKVLSGNVLVEFGAEWCGPCKAIKPLLEELSENFSVITVDVDKEDPSTLAEYGIRSIPTMIAFKDGKAFKRLTGMQSKATMTSIFE